MDVFHNFLMWDSFSCVYFFDCIKNLIYYIKTIYFSLMNSETSNLF